ncbi:hypothetical protein INT44_003474 [Umbelopsis vinacea]|uniref:Phosphoketolase n=1 Tax=Umbelopsis vinacea TaxID=44442 RepID=A0A8H7UEX7_9FUNG|nr:hypothetical protein INT44_003474 [Umbelopsis vinacea]
MSSLTSVDLDTSQYSVKLDISTVSKDDLAPYIKLQRATNFLAGAMIFLKSNVLLRQKLSFDDIKPRLLGHWGTCPAINLIYAHCTRIIKSQNQRMLLVTGPGHGAPANLANLYLEGSLYKFYPQYSLNEKGLSSLIRGFSWPGGFPSHTNSELPGQIHEGGELGYALAVSFGAALDKPDLVVTCIVGDGEAETGPTATAWHAIKYLDPVTCGAVLPILNLNGFKISERTIFGCMSDDELVALFTGYGYQCRIVGGNLDDVQQDMAASMEWALETIHTIQEKARSGNPIYKPRWPMLVLRTPKGWTGPKEAHGQQIEGTFHAHQVPLPKANADKEELELLEQWLHSYKLDELFSENSTPKKDVTDVFPEDDYKLGMMADSYNGYKPLDLPAWKDFCVSDANASPMKISGKFLASVIERNPQTFRMFCPDELMSNKLDAVFGVTGRTFEWDKDVFSKHGRIIEILSEHTCQAFLQGYTLTGRTGLFPSYEAFLGIVTTMVIQYAKFVKMGKETKWRSGIASLNYIETSTLWRQEHNGFSHQAPGFINSLVNLKSDMVRIYLPPDANCMVSTLRHCLNSKNYVNLMISSKHETAVWLNSEEAESHCRAGVSIWKSYSSDQGKHPHVVLVGCGVETTFEVLAATAMLRKDCPNLKVRVVNVTDLMVLGFDHPHALSSTEFESVFGDQQPIIFNFHGYNSVIKGLTFERKNVPDRISIHGYKEEGTTTTPFRMLTANGCSRFDIAIDALQRVAPNDDVDVDVHNLISSYRHQIREHEKYISQHGEDPAHFSERPKF